MLVPHLNNTTISCIGNNIPQSILYNRKGGGTTTIHRQSIYACKIVKGNAWGKVRAINEN
jgi:hypothetical protein